MKKLLIILCLFFSVANYTHAQTKEETISWLQEKLSKYLTKTHDSNIDNLSIKVETCNLIISYTWGGSNWEKVIPSDSATFSPYIKTKGERILTKRLDTNEKYYQQTIPFIQLPEAEEDLNNRVIKALNHLATFCPKTNETF